ncbi:SDR family NAD(P)-dependent oxidoreductase [Amycolatopsis sp. PS_44_ISF1]|uniref:SDR family oxidoreductase n=1 Tax=Amycolatopsis sp. PS_44_ISF1 TaxID=2974917 RepID=UPI0028E06A4B|nr:SDR family NAD(P)-dependent oxidoreductase [Amycolatopsis sp. PS_44_ISF1]MDT8913422.1 SDR family NAD(P)-dependent oxidoreductase [Amycolatopsis sp. PS_44_ISF1]
MKQSGNTVFLTGATSGIGLGLALRLHEAGNRVIVSGRRRDHLDRIAAEHPGISAVPLDVADPAQVARVAGEVTGAHPGLNVVATVAGIMHPEDLLDPAHLPTAEATVTTNLLGPIRVLSAFLPFLVEQPDATVLTVSSGLAFVPLPLTPTYAATKAAVHSYTESLRVQLAETPVRVLELVPPAVRTALMDQEQDERAMPLEPFLDEVMALLRTRDQGEILVETVKPLRFAERDGSYAGVLGMLSGL